MNKIPTIYQRDPANPKRVIKAITPGCEWVFDCGSPAVATRKYDGVCFMYDGPDTNQWWQRREVKPEQTVPPNFVEISVDATTGKRMGWIPARQSDRYNNAFLPALLRLTSHFRSLNPGTYELLGPSINGNPEKCHAHALVAHADASRISDVDMTWPRIQWQLRRLQAYGYEGIVWHHPDGRMAKIKVRDFDLSKFPGDELPSIDAGDQQL